MKKIWTILSILVMIGVTLVQCKKDPAIAPPIVEEPKPTAGFSFVLPDSAKFLNYKFNNTSTNYKQLLWQFGDDSTSAEVSPSHKYAFEGEYYITLTTRNGDGYSASRQILINVVDPDFDRTKVGESYFQSIGGTLTVSRDNGAGPNANEGSLKVVDGDLNTRFFQGGFAGDLWLKYELDSAALAGAYTLSSADADPDRDPKSWNLQGSEDGIKWITLDTRSNILFSARKQTKLFHFNNNVLYKFFRLNIKQDNGSRDFQMSEWTVNKKQP